MRGDITDKGILHRNDVGVSILLQFDAQFSAFGIESKHTTSFTFFFGLDRERLIATLPNRYSGCVERSASLASFRNSSVHARKMCDRLQNISSRPASVKMDMEINWNRGKTRKAGTMKDVAMTGQEARISLHD